MDKGKIKQFLFRLYEKSFDEDIFSNAAQVAFYFLFALFPLLVFLISIFGIILGQSNEMRSELFNYMAQVMPASAYELVFKTMDEVIQGSSSGKITFGLAATLYSASAGIDNLRAALNDVYTLSEERSWWKRKLMSLLLTLGLGMMIFLALGIVFYGSQFINLILDKFGLPISSPFLLQALSVVIVLSVLLVTFDVLYYFAPNHKDLKWTWLTPGAVVAIALWLLASKGFSIYLGYFDSYAKTYGSLGAIIVLMLWLYITGLVVLFGGVVNSVLNEFSRGQYEKLDPLEKKLMKLSDEDKANLPNLDLIEEKLLKKHSNQENTENINEKPETERGETEKFETDKAPTKSTFKVIAGAVLVSIIELFSFKKKR